RALATTQRRADSGASMVVSAVRTTPVARASSPSTEVGARGGAAASARRAGRQSRYARADLIVTTPTTSPVIHNAKEANGSITRYRCASCHPTSRITQDLPLRSEGYLRLLSPVAAITPGCLQPRDRAARTSNNPSAKGARRCANHVTVL